MVRTPGAQRLRLPRDAGVRESSDRAHSQTVDAPTPVSLSVPVPHGGPSAGGFKLGDVEAQASEGQGATGSGSTEKRNAVGATMLSRFGLFPTRTFTSEIAVPVPVAAPARARYRGSGRAWLLVRGWVVCSTIQKPPHGGCHWQPEIAAALGMGDGRGPGLAISTGPTLHRSTTQEMASLRPTLGPACSNRDRAL